LHGSPGPSLVPYSTLFRSKSRPPVGRRGSIGGRSGGFGAEDALRWVNELKLERRNRFCPRRAGSDRRILGVLSASTSTSNRVLRDRKSTRLNSSHEWISYA